MNRAADHILTAIGFDRFQTSSLQFGGAQAQPTGQRRNIESACRRRERAFERERKLRPHTDQGVRRRRRRKRHARIDGTGIEICLLYTSPSPRD